MKNHAFLGVDQTGAINSKGAPKPLPCCLIKNNKVRFFYLESFSKNLILKESKEKNAENIFICADCVLGLPNGLNMTWRQALKKIKSHPGYGLKVAKEYFTEIGRGKVWRRNIEIISGSNSVFQEKPYQKNIQTGTYRIWKNISESEADFFAPFLGEKSRAQAIPIFEGYPSYSWKLLFQVSQRSPEQLLKLIDHFFPNLSISVAEVKQLQKDSNLADAFVLALTLTQFKSIKESQTFKNEGWILGFPKDKSIQKENK